MKTFKFLFLGAVMLFNMVWVKAQADSGSIIKPFGMGLHLEQLSFNSVADYKSGSVNKIVLTISPMNSLRLEPEIGFKFDSDDANNMVYYGLGVFTMSQLNKLNIYYGLRLEYADIHWQEIKSLSISGTEINKIMSDNRIRRTSMGPAVGCEYYLGSNFSIGGEFAIIYRMLKIDSQNSNADYYEETNIGSNVGVFMRFYF